MKTRMNETPTEWLERWRQHNARMAAQWQMEEAAPDLYAALKRIVDGINDEWHPLFNSPGPMSDDERKALERAEAALAKAKGR